ncbi:hypothetical protein quinque_004577 [Culex quinquefasciatus]
MKLTTCLLVLLTNTTALAKHHPDLLDYPLRLIEYLDGVGRFECVFFSVSPWQLSDSILDDLLQHARLRYVAKYVLQGSYRPKTLPKKPSVLLLEPGRRVDLKRPDTPASIMRFMLLFHPATKVLVFLNFSNAYVREMARLMLVRVKCTNVVFFDTESLAIRLGGLENLVEIVRFLPHPKYVFEWFKQELWGPNITFVAASENPDEPTFRWVLTTALYLKGAVCEIPKQKDGTNGADIMLEGDIAIDLVEDFWRVFIYEPVVEKSPRRYIESDVNIHYKTPIRYEYKEAIPDDELAYRQAEHMRRVYQEERRRKYMHELEDLQNRRHTDNFVPAQKSPIPVNRYEDFDADLAPKPNNVLPRTIARALYNFQGQTARELSFKKGDIIYLRRQIDKNWYEGEHNAMIGLLPANYIEILPRDGAKPLPKKPQREGKARAKFNFTAQTTVELSLLKGELVTLTRRVDDNWFEGRIGNKKGIFPVSYVEVLTDIGGEESYEIEPIVKPNLQTIQTHTLTTGYDNGLINGRVSPGIIRETKTVQKTEVLHVDTTNEPISYRALYNYKPQNSDELELLEGDVVYVLEKCDDGWYVGTSARTGCFGTFPGNYVKKL